MFSRRHSNNPRRHATVLVMVVGVLAMLFIIGSTLLMMVRFERQTVETKGDTRNLKMAGVAVNEPVLTQLREDAVGTDGTAYNRGWPKDPANAFSIRTGDSSNVEDAVDFSGYARPTGTPTPNQIIRAGDLLMSSVEPYYDTATSKWQLYWPSWSLDSIPTVGGVPFSPPAAPLDIGLTHRAWDGLGGDADGDGIRDCWLSNSSGGTSVTGMFGLNPNMNLRTVPHGGMVLLDKFEHPSLLAQAIHPDDITSISTGSGLLNHVGNNMNIDPAIEEPRLRRRFLLTGDEDPNATPVDPTWPTDAKDVRNQLKKTLGYVAPSGASTSVTNLTPHWWVVNDQINAKDATWWTSRLLPGIARTEASYSANTDVYDRRHLITTVNSDDVLRRQRDEIRLLKTERTGLPTGVVNDIFNASDGSTPPVYHPLYYVLNPDPAGGTDAFGLSKFPDNAYGRVSGTLEFNKGNLRTQFSLRDVLVDPASNGGYQASYKRAEQLMAYYLAMIQHTTVPGSAKGGPVTIPANLPSNSDLKEQLRTAAQLAVNTIDFADNADANGNGTVDSTELTDPATYFEWPPRPATGTPNVQVTVCGIEKQPFMTEAFAKMVAPYDINGALDITTALGKTKILAKSIFAVELYNPYDVKIDLNAYRFRLGGVLVPVAPKSLGSEKAAMSGGDHWLNPGQRLLFANLNKDPDNATNPNLPFDGLSGNVANIVVLGNTFRFSDVFSANPTAIPIELVRIGPDATGSAPEKDANGVPYVLNLANPAVPAPDIVVDRLETTASLQATPTAIDHWAQRPSLTELQNNTTLPNGPHPKASTTYIMYSSLQRHKEPGWQNLTAGPSTTPAFVPVYWHFSLSRQKAFDSPVEVQGVPPTAARQVHDLLGVARAADDKTHYVTEVDQSWTGAANEQPIAGFPVITADRGIDGLTKGCQSFPTTGSLLLVTRYAPLPKDTSNGVALDTPVTVTATRAVSVTNAPAANQAWPAAGNLRQAVYQMQQLDNGHMPVFDSGQVCLDATATDPAFASQPQGRLDIPWGQLVYDYFTALPMEELFRIHDVSADSTLSSLLTGLGYDPTKVRPADVNVPDVFRRVYARVFTNDTVSGYATAWPVNEPIAGQGLGAKVRGRVNVNFAPWWLLDGLPVLTAGEVGSTHAMPASSYWSMAGLPVSELRYDRLDPVSVSEFDLRPATKFSASLFDERSDITGTSVPPQVLSAYTGYVAPPTPVFDLPSISPMFARAIVSYRERRPVNGVSITPPTAPGLLSLGALSDVLERIPVVVKNPDPATSGYLTAMTLGALHNHYYTDSTGTLTKPFSYLGYLQLVAPMVRLQDWATTRNHTFTVYSTVGTDGQPPVYLRTQVTVDRTRCLYSNEMPERITETEPTGYYNAVSDQK